jgi:hypothetical protein
MEHNPYAPPKAPVHDNAPGEAGDEVPTERLYSPGQAALAAFLGGPFAGAWFIAANLRALGRRGQALPALLIGFLATAALFSLAVVMPENIPTFAFTIGVCGTAAGITHVMFSRDIERHERAGGDLGSWWRVVGISLLWGLAIVVLVFAVVFTLVAMGVMEP